MTYMTLHDLKTECQKNMQKTYIEHYRNVVSHVVKTVVKTVVNPWRPHGRDAPHRAGRLRAVDLSTSSDS